MRPKRVPVPHDDCIVVLEFGDTSYWRGLIQLEMRCLGDVFGNRFRNTFYIHLRTGRADINSDLGVTRQT